LLKKDINLKESIQAM